MREAYWPLLASAIRLRWSPAKAAGEVDAVDRDLVLVESGDLGDRTVGKCSVGEEEDGVGSQREGLLHGGAGIGAAVGIDQAEERPQLLLRLLVRRARNRAAGHGDRFVIVEDHLESLRLAQAEHTAPQLDGGPRHPIVVDHASGTVDDVHEKLAARTDAEKRSLPPGRYLAPVDGPVGAVAVVWVNRLVLGGTGSWASPSRPWCGRERRHRRPAAWRSETWWRMTSSRGVPGNRPKIPPAFSPTPVSAADGFACAFAAAAARRLGLGAWAGPGLSRPR